MDIYGRDVSLLLHMTGSNNGTSFIDSSFNNLTVTASGAKTSTAQYKWSSSSGYFDGNNANLSIANNTLFQFGSAPFTIEFWIYPINNTGVTTVITKGWPTNYPPFLCYGSANASYWTPYFYASGNGTSWNIIAGASGPAVTRNAWHHIAFVRDDSGVTIYSDGVGGTKALSTATLVVNSSALTIGMAENGSDDFYGYLQDIRITKNIARYTGNFTPPQAIFDNPAVATIQQPTLAAIVDITDGGLYRITGEVTELGIAGRYRVRLFDRQSARCVRETWSNASGAYAFDNLAYRANGYFAIAYDHGDNPLNAAIADLITPELMP